MTPRPYEPHGRHPVYHSKQFGLHELERVCPQTGATFLPYRVFTSPDSFSIDHFGSPDRSRLIIRCDPQSNTQTMTEWVSMPRININIDRSNPDEINLFVRAWMQEQRQKFGGRIQFIVHKVRMLSDYENSVQVNVDLGQGDGMARVRIHVTPAQTDKFRDERGKVIMLEYNPITGKFRRPVGEMPEIQLSPALMSTLQRTIHHAAGIAMDQRQRFFEMSAVTYTDAPHMPEFYDFILGKPD